jgi:hypothetical protein
MCKAPCLINISICHNIQFLKMRNIACKSMSTGAQYVTPDNEIYCKKVKMCRFSSGNWFFSTKFVQLTVAVKVCNTVVRLQKRVQ